MNDLDYYRRREPEERARAGDATVDCARRIHEHLADTYARRAAATARLPAADNDRHAE